MSAGALIQCLWYHSIHCYTGPSGHLPVIYTHKILRKWLGPGFQELLSPCCLGERWLNGVLNKTFVKVSTNQMLRVVHMCGIVTSAQCCGKCQSKQPAISRSTLNLHCWKFNRDIFLLVNEKSCNLLLSAGWYITIWQAIVNLYTTRLAPNVWYSHPMWVWNLHSILEQTHYSQVQMQVFHPVWSTADFQHEDMHDCKLLRLLSYLTLPRRRAVIGVPLLRQVQTCSTRSSPHTRSQSISKFHTPAGAGNCLLYAIIVVRTFAG